MLSSKKNKNTTKGDTYTISNIITENFFQSKPAIDSIESFCDKYVTSVVLMSCGIKKQADIGEAKAVEYIVPD
jgi:hypothetical protein